MENLSVRDEHESREQQQEQRPRHLPTYLITRILLCLPPKSLARFKTVAKSWNTLISSRPFIITHINRSLTTLTNLHLARLGKSTVTTLPFPALDSSPQHGVKLPFTVRAPDADLIGSHHGVLCISDYPNFLALYSPTTHTCHVTKLTDPNPMVESHWVDFGFGYDPVGDDYRVVRVDQLNGPGTAGRTRVVRVYSVKKCHWKMVEPGFPYYLTHPKNHGRYASNNVHWMTSVKPPKVYDLSTRMKHRGQSDTTYYRYVIVSLDMTTDTFDEVDMPLSCCEMKKRVFPKPWLAVLGGKLVVQIEHGVISKRVVELWMMMEYGVTESWVKLFTWRFEECFSGVGRVKPVEVSRDGREVLMERNANKESRFYWIRVGSGKVRGAGMEGRLKAQFDWIGGHACEFGAVMYADSLVVLNDVGIEFTEVPVVKKANKPENDDKDRGKLMGQPSGEVMVPGRFILPIGYRRRVN